MATQQLTLNFEGGLTRQYRTLLDVLAAGTYRHGLQRCAAAMDQAPSNVSAMLSGQRHFPAEGLEQWIKETGDHSPIFWLIEKFLETPENRKDQALDRLSAILPEIEGLVREAKR